MPSQFANHGESKNIEIYRINIKKYIVSKDIIRKEDTDKYAQMFLNYLFFGCEYKDPKMNKLMKMFKADERLLA
jgi:hypothetical protein